MLLLNISVNKPAFSRGVRGRLQHPGQQNFDRRTRPARALIRSALCRKHGYPGACRFQQFSVRVHYCTNCIRVRLPIKCTRTCRRGVGPSPVTLSWVESPGSRLFFTRASSCFEWSWPRGACCCCCAMIPDVYFLLHHRPPRTVPHPSCNLWRHFRLMRVTWLAGLIIFLSLCIISIVLSDSGSVATSSLFQPRARDRSSVCCRPVTFSFEWNSQQHQWRVSSYALRAN